MDRKGWKLMHVEEVPEGRCFVKRTGMFAYLRLSQATVQHHRLDVNKVYGVCYNGNMTAIDRGKYVWSVPLSVMEANRAAERRWEAQVGVEDTSPYLPVDPE